MERRGGISGPEARAFQEIFAAEGGRREDPRGAASSGITQGTLDDLIARGKVGGITSGTRPSQLSPDQRVDVYRGYFEDVMRGVGGSGALARIGDEDAAAAFGDTLFRHGRKGGTEAIQRAINGVAPGAVTVDGRIGPATLGAFDRLAHDPATRRRLLDALADERTKLAPLERERFDHFRFQRP
jgi:lysozyme family protein